MADARWSQPPRCDSFIAVPMSKFGVTTWVAVAAASVVTIVFKFPLCLWALIWVWAIYLPICAGGVAFIRWNFYCRAVCTGRAGSKRVALTFDDGPDAAATPAVLDLLKEERIQAAFFCVGKRIDAYPEIAARIAAEGHLLANHTYRHPWFICMLWSLALKREFERGQEAIEKITASKPMFLRPPMGMTSLHFPRVLKSLGLTLVGWDVRSLDTVVSAKRAIGRVNRLSGDGSIILLHDGGLQAEKIVEIVRGVIRDLRAKGLEFERLDRLVEGTSDANYVTNQYAAEKGALRNYEEIPSADKNSTHC
jgi:peptidoglycan/xylan/chitin deacetylase (PgdA/CDA1 family)